MATDISPNNEQFIQQEIANGSFGSREEALDTAVDMLRQRRQLIDRLKESRRQLDDGEFIELDATGLQQLFDTLQQRALNRTAGSNG